METKKGTGALFRNNRKTNEKQPDWTGNVVTPNGEELTISLWVRTSSKGTEYLSAAISEPFKKADNGKSETPKSKPMVNSADLTPKDDDLPF